MDYIERLRDCRSLIPQQSAALPGRLFKCRTFVFCIVLSLLELLVPKEISQKRLANRVARFCVPKCQAWFILEGLGMEKFGLFYGHLVY
jgi:hypothetical protein